MTKSAHAAAQHCSQPPCVTCRSIPSSNAFAGSPPEGSVALFKKIITKSGQGQQVDEIAFLQGTVVVTGVKVGAVPGGIGAASQQRAGPAPFIQLFARDLASPSSGRYAALCVPIDQPTVGSTTLPLQASGPCKKVFFCCKSHPFSVISITNTLINAPFALLSPYPALYNRLSNFERALPDSSAGHLWLWA